jgi:hypothetical protein
MTSEETKNAETKKRGRTDCIQDGYENSPFACIGGLSARENPRKPKWLSDEDFPAWLEGYLEAAAETYGPDWRTVEFGWRKALEIPGTPR